jgi:LacI family transcriptional regulator
MLPHLRRLERAGLPVVTFLESEYARRPVNIAVDNYLQGYLATEHIMVRGCEHIVHFRVGDARYEGYAGALREKGRRLDPALVVRCPHYSVMDGRLAVRKLLRSQIKFDAIVAQSDGQAFGACMELREQGIAVPDQVRIIGVDDSSLCLASPVSLSSVTSESVQVGVLTVEAILHKIGGGTVEPRLLHPRVIQRNSS